MHKLKDMKDGNKYKILIIIPRYNLTDKKDYYYVFPLGLGYISSVLKKAGYDVDCLNLNHIDGAITKLVKKKLDKKEYDFVGVGNTALGYIITEIIIKVVRAHKSKPKILLGGSIITPQPKLVFNDLNPDFGVIGEGEETVLELLECIRKKGNLRDVKGIIYRNENHEMVITEKRIPIENLNSLPFPDFEGFGFEEQIVHMHTNHSYVFNAFDFPRVYSILCSRSCPFQCTFCYHEGKYRTRSLDSIIDELNLMVKKYKINIILIYDDCFAIDKKRLNEFCKRIKKLKEEISWDLVWIPQLTVREVSPELLKLMKESGCDTISYGFESFSKDVLKSMRKPITPKQIDKAFKMTLDAGIAIQANFIFGDPAETRETAKETLDYWKKNARGQIFLGFIQPYPGSKIYQHCIKKGIIKDEINFIKTLTAHGDLILNMTDKMTDKEIFQLRKEMLEATSKYFGFVSPIRVKKTSHKIWDIDMICPYCHSHIKYRNCFIDNKFYYGFIITCRNCRMRFFIVSSLKKLVFRHYYKFYNSTRRIKSLYTKITSSIKRIKFKFFN